MFFKNIRKTVIGDVILIGSDKGLYATLFGSDSIERIKLPEGEIMKENNKFHLFDTVEMQLNEYFQGKRHIFTVPLDLRFGTLFQQKVWTSLRAIPYGKTWSYAKLAKSIGNPRALRAVGNANGKNPLCIITPCHRVIASDGSLGGYSGGLSIKKQLLGIEAKSRSFSKTD